MVIGLIERASATISEARRQADFGRLVELTPQREDRVCRLKQIVGLLGGHDAIMVGQELARPKQRFGSASGTLGELPPQRFGKGRLKRIKPLEQLCSSL